LPSRPPRHAADHDAPLARVAGLFVACVVAFALPAAAELVSVPGTRVSLEPPPGFALADRFPGFGHAESGASILITDMPAPVAEVRKGMSAEGLAGRGMTVLSSETVTSGAGEVLLVAATQRAGQAEVSKWMAISGDADHTLIVLATYPTGHAATLAAPLRAAVLSAQRSAAAPDMLAGLPFALVESGALKIATRVGNALLLTEGGVQRTLGPGEPLLVAAASLSEVDLDDLGAFAERRLRQTEQLVAPWKSSGQELEIAGLRAWELAGEAADKRNGQPVKVYQLIVADGPRDYFIVQGLVSPARWDELLPQFRAVAHSLRKRGPTGDGGH
jgi:hypothetical protein